MVIRDRKSRLFGEVKLGNPSFFLIENLHIYRGVHLLSGIAHYMIHLDITIIKFILTY
jgi:hypothetical protein